MINRHITCTKPSWPLAFTIVVLLILPVLLNGCPESSNNNQPATKGSFSYSPVMPTVNQPVTFTAVNPCSTCSSVEFSWDFDFDGVPDVAGQSVQHSFPMAGTYYFYLFVTIDGVDQRKVESLIYVTTLAGDTVDLRMLDASQAEAIGPIYASSITTTTLDPTRSEITVIGTVKIGGPHATVTVQYDTVSGANPVVEFTWGTDPLNDIYCTDCAAHMSVVINGNYIHVSLVNLHMASGADPNINGIIDGPIDVTAVSAADCGTYPAVGDAYVSSGDPTSSLGGISSALQVSSISAGSADKAYLVFDVGSIPSTFTSVKLALRTLPGSMPGATTRMVNLFGITDNNDWDPASLAENQINWNNAPQNDTSSATSFLNQGGDGAAVQLVNSVTIGPADGDTLLRLDISDYVRWAIGAGSNMIGHDSQDSDGQITIMLAHDAIEPFENTDLFRSREASVGDCDRPHLEVNP